MKYQMSIKGMHCKGCANLIKMSLEDEGLTNVAIDLPSETGNFEGNEDAKVLLEKAFAGLSGYDFADLKTIS